MANQGFGAVVGMTRNRRAAGRMIGQAILATLSQESVWHPLSELRPIQGSMR
jgi:hypothetical protein